MRFCWLNVEGHLDARRELQSLDNSIMRDFKGICILNFVSGFFYLLFSVDLSRARQNTKRMVKCDADHYGDV